jgi:hypothetical protein
MGGIESFLASTALEISSEAAGPILFGLFGALVAVIYNSVDKRIERCEKNFDVLQEIRADIKIIRAACPSCPDLPKEAENANKN